MGTAIAVVGGLALFLYGMKKMSEALQNVADDKLEQILWKFTSNRFKGVFSGIALTALIQSSSAATVMTVGFVTAGLLSLTQAIGIVMGANIGTTITGWLIAVIGFKVKVSALALPAVAIGFFARFFNNTKISQWGEVLLGFGILFLGFSIMGEAVSGLKDAPEVMALMGRFRADTIPTTLAVLAVGALITIIVQSSSATMAMTMALAFNGVIDFNTACALVLGENIGTTVTANLAAIGTSTDARRTARAHLLLNVFGVLWVMITFHSILLPLVDAIVPGDLYSKNQVLRTSAIPEHLAAFHTLFNVINILIFLPLVNLLVFMVTKIVPDSGDSQEKPFKLKYITTALVSTPAMNITQAKRETQRMFNLVAEMFKMVLDIHKDPPLKIENAAEKIFTMEKHIDLLEKEISVFLVRISLENKNKEMNIEISLLLQRVNEIEKIGDQCENLLKVLCRKHDLKTEFSDTAIAQFDEIAEKVAGFIELLGDGTTEYNENILQSAYARKKNIIELRKKLRTDHVQRLVDGLCDANAGLLFLDMLSICEKIGNHLFNTATGIASERSYPQQPLDLP